MTAETSTTISSISGANINTISGASKPHNAQKRTIHQFETDKIEVQTSEQTTAPTTLNKVSCKRCQCRKILARLLDTRIRYLNRIQLLFPRRKTPGPTKRAKEESKTTWRKREWENYGFFSPLFSSLKMGNHLDDPFSHTPLILDARVKWA